MNTTLELINSLKKDKENLNTMLNNMGVETTGNETFTKLVPLVGKIVSDPILQDKTVTITENGTTNIVADEGFDGLNNVEVNVDVEKSNLSYTLLESIETQKTFGQYLNTNYKINNNTRIVMKFSRDVNIQGGSMFGVFQDEGATSMLGYHSNETQRNRLEFYYGNPVQIALVGDSGTLKNNTDFIIDANKNTWTLYDFNGNVLGSKTFEEVEFETPYTTPIMAARVRSSDINQYGYSKLYYCKIYDNEELIYDIVPAIDQNGIVCAFNKVDEKFMYNQGIGEFVAGNIVEVIRQGLQDKTVTITENGTTNITPDEGYDGLNNVEVVTNIESSGGGDTSIEDGLITRTLTEYSNSRVTTIGKYALFNFTNLTKINFPNATVLDKYACSELSNLVSVEIPLVEEIGMRGFYLCKKLPEINLPKVVSIGDYSFYQNSKLTTINAPLVETLGANVFQNCSVLKNVNMPKLQKIGNYCFSGCAAIEKLDLPVCTTIANYGLQTCNALTTLILRSNTLCTLGTYGITQSTSAIGKGTGYIYVPKVLIEDYKVANNWSTFANQFRAIEDYPDICG